jgi:hypothetical protein
MNSSRVLSELWIFKNFKKMCLLTSTPKNAGLSARTSKLSANKFSYKGYCTEVIQVFGVFLVAIDLHLQLVNIMKLLYMI